jgi:DNA-binding XRE family transcriptional regulator
MLAHRPRCGIILVKTDLSRYRMNNKEFIKARHLLGKTQVQLAQLLSVSPKAIQSFEQGWRNIPIYTERHLLFLIFQKKSVRGRKKACWVIKKCPTETRRNCPAWEFRVGNLCWFINGTICQGEVQQNWQKKIKLCRQCEVFRSTLLSDLE